MCVSIREGNTYVSDRHFMVTLAVTLPEGTAVGTPDKWNFDGIVNPDGTPDNENCPTRLILATEYPVPKEKLH